MKKIHNVTAVVGGQFGSEGKGVVVAHRANDFDVHIRTGGPNAGHSFHHAGRCWKMQAVPCGWKNKQALLLLGPGAVVNLDVLAAEMNLISEVDPSIYERVVIDYNATILDQRHHDAEGGVAGELHARIGSTGEGVGAARLARIGRDPTKVRQARDLPQHEVFCGRPMRSYLGDVMAMLAAHGDNPVMLEGTQGFGLSLTHGQWPHVTSHDTTAAQLAADAGVPPWAVSDVVLVVRTMPIRVAGPSGPLRSETTWQQLSSELGRPVEEKTTVTKKIRRVGHWDENLVARAARVNGATEVAVTFLDYLSPEDNNVREFEKLSVKSRTFVDYLERFLEVPVHLMGTGWSEADGWSYVER